MGGGVSDVDSSGRSDTESDEPFWSSVSGVGVSSELRFSFGEGVEVVELFGVVVVGGGVVSAGIWTGSGISNVSVLMAETLPE